MAERKPPEEWGIKSPLSRRRSGAEFVASSGIMSGKGCFADKPARGRAERSCFVGGLKRAGVPDSVEKGCLVGGRAAEQDCVEEGYFMD